MMDNFAPSLAHVLASEGGYVDDPRDPGGATNEGITQKTYDLCRALKKLPSRPVRQIDPNEAEAIYRCAFWNALSCDELPSGVDYCVFDAGVNSGARQAAKWLQRTVDVPDDGYIGKITLSAVNAADPRRIINGVCSERLAFLETLPTWPHFGNGWSRRVATVEMAARGMAC